MASMMMAAIVSNIEMIHKSVICPPITIKLVSMPMFSWSRNMIKPPRVVLNKLLSL